VGQATILLVDDERVDLAIMRAALEYVRVSQSAAFIAVGPRA